MEKISTKDTWKYIFLALGFLLLLFLAKDIGVFWMKGKSFFVSFLFFDVGKFKAISFLRGFFQPVVVVNAFLYDLIKNVFSEYVCKDPYNFTPYFLFAPVFEEIQFRGPFYLLKNYSDKIWWKVTAVVVCVVFTLIHRKWTPGLILIFSMSLANIWLIRKTGRFWPAILLHALYNMSIIFSGISYTLFN